METQSPIEVSGSHFDEISIESGQNSPNTDELNTNFTIIDADPLALPVEYEEKYGLKTCLVELERCDKIWETIQLIRNLQDDDQVSATCKENNLDECDENLVQNDNKKSDENELLPIQNDTCDSTIETNRMMPYIKYQPVLGNGNTALPNFQFSVQRTRVLYPCHICGKQYSHTRSLKEHSERVHNIVIPSIRKKTENTDNKSISKLDGNNMDSPDDSSEQSNTDNDFQNSINDQQLLNNLSAIHVTDEISGEIIKYSCPFCDKSYKDKYTLNKHIKGIHGKDIGLNRAYKKKNVPTDSENASNKIRRIKQSRSLDVYRCKTCGKHFYSSRTFRQHSRKVHGIYVRSKKKVVSEHYNMKIGKAEKNMTQTTLSLSGHSLSYELNETTTPTVPVKSKVIVRKCPVCKKAYRDPVSWKNHCINIHGLTIQPTRALPTELEDGVYDCNICGTKFSNIKEVDKHYKSDHHQYLRFKCKICKSLFCKVDSLINHSIKVHKIFLLLRRAPRRRKRCNVCGITCVNIDILKSHINREHCNNSSSKKFQVQKKKKVGQKKVGKSVVVSTKGKLQKNEKTCFKDNNLSPNKNSDNIILGQTSPNNRRKKGNHNQHGSSKKLKSNKNDTLTVNSNLVNNDFTKCILCEKQFKNIRKHFMEYHKVRHPDSLISQCSTVPSDNHEEHKNDNKLSTNNTEQTSSKRSVSKPKYKKSKGVRKQRFPGSERLFVRISRPDNEKFYVCKYCPFSSNNYDAMRIDEKIHLREGVTSETTPSTDYLNTIQKGPRSPIKSKKRKRESIDNRETQRRRLSPSVNEIRNTRASAKFKEEYYHICSICNRTFRSTEILKSHKVSCKNRTDQTSVIDGSDTRASSDRDSGIGISITIKKKNNSYEIVSRDSIDDKSSDSTSFQEISANDVSIDNVSNPCSTNVQHGTDNKLNESFEYSQHHEFIKIQQAEDLDVDIVSDSENQNNSNSHNQVIQPVIQPSTDVQKDSVVNTEKTDNSGKLHQVLPLKTLCQKALAAQTFVNKVDNVNQQVYKCNVCHKTWASMFSLSAHNKVHMKARKKLNP